MARRYEALSYDDVLSTQEMTAHQLDASESQDRGALIAAERLSLLPGIKVTILHVSKGPKQAGLWVAHKGLFREIHAPNPPAWAWRKQAVYLRLERGQERRPAAQQPL
jgi:hypothetical protein